MKSLRHPHRNALVLGLLQGVPQGLIFPDQTALVKPGFDALSSVPVVCFGLLGPPLIMLLSHLASRRKEPPWIAKAREYVDLPEMIFWAGMSLGLIGLLSLKRVNAQEGYAVCAFFIAAGIGFLCGGLLEKRLRQRARGVT